jgi:hypothetical protein
LSLAPLREELRLGLPDGRCDARHLVAGRFDETAFDEREATCRDCGSLGHDELNQAGVEPSVTK